MILIRIEINLDLKDLTFSLNVDKGMQWMAEFKMPHCTLQGDALEPNWSQICNIRQH